MSQLGERLRHARESRGISLAEAAAETRIRQQSLLALEEGNFEVLPNDVVAKGFIRNYANVLDLPADELIEIYRIERGSSQPIRVVPATTTLRSRSYVLPGFFGVFFVTIALVALAYVVLSASGQIRDPAIALQRAEPTATISAPTPTQLSTEVPTPTPETVAQSSQFDPDSQPVSRPTRAPTATAEDNDDDEPIPEPTATAEDDDDDEPTPEPTATRTALVIPTLPVAGAESTATTPQATETPEAPIVVEVSVLPGNGQGSWMRVTTDGVVVYEQIMPPGTQQRFLAERSVNIRAGNPTFVLVSVNGLPPEPLGQVPGEPVDWSWPPQ